MSPTTATRDFLVQRANARSDEWKTIATKNSQEDADEQFARSLKCYMTGKLRIVDPDGTVLKEQEARFLFSDN